MKGRCTLWMIMVSTLLLSSCEAPPRLGFPIPVAADYSRTPVVFVHGRLVENYMFDPMIGHLVIRGWPAEYLYKVDYESKDMPNVLAAESQLVPEIEAFLLSVRETCEMRADTCPQFDKVDFVAHSMGAVSSRWYTAKLHPERVRTWISLAGANHGSSPSCPGPPNSGKRDLCPAYAETAAENPVQFALNGSPLPDVDETPYGVGQDSDGVDRVFPDSTRQIIYFTLRVKRDQFVAPPESPTLDGAGGVSLNLPAEMGLDETSAGNYLVRRKMGHDELPTNRLAAKFVELALLARR